MSTTISASLDAESFEENYQRWKTDPRSVDPTWSSFFEGYELGRIETDSAQGDTADGHVDAATAASHDHIEAYPEAFQSARERGFRYIGAGGAWQARVDSLVFAYRMLGHTIAQIDPLGTERKEQPLLSLKELGFTEDDLDRDVSSPYFLGGLNMCLREMVDELRKIYAGPIGAEFMHIQNTRIRNWLRDRLDVWPEVSDYSKARRKRILRVLLEAEGFERFLHTKFLGQKRFSLEGGESLMVSLDTLYRQCKEHDVKEIVMGMAHRGRLNVLANFLQKPHRIIFSEFQEGYIPESVYGNGDVKYHLGYRTTRGKTNGHHVAIQLAANPSHLEAVDPVVMGMARARQRILEDTEKRKQVLPVLVHGDAAFAGQGIVAEILNFSQLPGYRTGGTVHIIVNNQIGFTTLPADARSSDYCTDVAKMIDAPIFHVNGDHPEAVAFVTDLAFDFRQHFGRDVVIDMYCFRRHGHNEGDEPMFTQPDLYSRIKNHPSTGEIFKERLIADEILSTEEIDEVESRIKSNLDAAFDEAKKAQANSQPQAGREAAADQNQNNQKQRNGARDEKRRFDQSTAVFQPPYSHQPVDTSVSREALKKVVQAITTVPKDMEFLDKIKKMLLDRRKKIFDEGGPYDWGYGETLAIGTLLLEGTPVRLSGQDSRRGTFSHRHSALYDVNTRERYFPLKDIDPAHQATFCVYNSPLSEASVLGFDYGYSIEYPQMLCLWEAQFGDFANGAQVIIDQFIAAAESKWQQPSGLVLLLPHGYEGQGPEHSSARMERFLQLCGENNMQVANLTTPAQFFHILRRQVKRSFRKPLIIMTPKSLLRHTEAVSSEEDFTKERFHEILDDASISDPARIKRVILCCGKVYYDLVAERKERELESEVALVRVEQVYPLHEQELKKILDRYAKARKLIWCQEEHENMGAWSFMEPQLRQLSKLAPVYAGRDRSATPATGLLAVHKIEQKQLLTEAFEK